MALQTPYDAGRGVSPFDQITAKGVVAKLGLSAATVLKTGAGRVARVSVIVAGSTAGSVNDCSTTGAAAQANQIAAIPNTVGTVLTIDFPFLSGLTIVPGTSQVLAVSYE